MKSESAYYAAYLNLRDALCVVIGGGKVAKRKIETLIACQASVRCISPEIESEIHDWVNEGRIEHIARKYRTGDVADAVLVFAATHDSLVNQSVCEEAKHFGKLVNVVDHPASCSFIVPATYRRGSLQIAISTSGENPAMAKRMRTTLEQDIQDGTEHFIGEIRRWLGRR